MDGFGLREVIKTYMFEKEITSRFCRSFVLGDVTDVVQYIIDADDVVGAPFTEEDVSNYTIRLCPKCGEDVHGYVPSDLTGEDGYVCQHCGAVLFEYELEYYNDPIEQWLVVNEYLGRMLTDNGHVVIRNKYWGRRDKDIPLNEDEAIVEICKQIGLFAKE